jgi:uncharacterized protein (UPF0332 family)
MRVDSVRALAQTRLGQAAETLREAETLAQAALWRGAINRACYAMFYAVQAPAVWRQVSLSKHSGAIAFFDREFIKPGLMAREHSRELHLGFNRRQAADYGEMPGAVPEEAQQAVAEARSFVAAVADFLQGADAG